MTRKIGLYALLIFIIYGLFFYWYLFHFADTSIPFEYEGSSADPATFLNERELMLSEEYSKVKNFLFFLSTPFEWFVYLFILITGISKVFNNWAENTSKYSVVRTAIYVFWISIFTFVVTFPISYYSYSVSKSYRISTQSFSSWMKDELIDFWIDYGMLFIIVLVLYWLINKSRKRWWIYAWLISIPFSIFLMFIQPVVIDPLYNDFYPLKNKELEEKILSLADKANIPADHVFEVNMAEKTNALNAYVTGIGSNSRIVLWDTTLNRLNEDQVLFIMAHEMAHYVEKHIYFGIAGFLLISLLGLFITARLMERIVHSKWGEYLKVKAVNDMQSLPLLLLILTMLMFVVSPFENIASRYEEMRADKYALEMTENPEVAVQTFQELTRAGLSQVNPPLLVKIFRYTHPTMLERITMVEEYEIQKRIEQSK